MSKGQVHIKCTKCGTFNVDEDVCTQCGTMLNMVREREIVRHTIEKKRIEDDLAKPPSKTDAFLRKMMNHPWLVVRLFFKLVYGIWFVLMAVTMFLAWVIGLLAG